MSTENQNQNYFSQAEAEGKVGKHVQTRVDFSAVPKGSSGTVISADLVGTSQIGDIANAVYDVAIQWDDQAIEAALAAIDKRLEKVEANENTIERNIQLDRLLEDQDALLFLQSQKPLVDWFTKEDYERYLEELTAGDETSPTTHHLDQP